MNSAGVGGVYRGPGGIELYGDGREVRPITGLLHNPPSLPMTTPADSPDLTKMKVRELCWEYSHALPYQASRVIAELERRCSPPADVRDAAEYVVGIDSRSVSEGGKGVMASFPAFAGRSVRVARWVAGLGRTGGASP